MTAVECSAKNRPYCRQVSAGLLASEPLTGRSISAGLRTAWTIQFMDAQTATSRIAETMIRNGGGARRSAASPRPAERHGAERRARWRRRRPARGAACEFVADDITAYSF